MKYMRLGTKPDTFYTVEAVRSVMSDIPTDLVVHINNTRYLLHKFPLLLKCGLLQRLCCSDISANAAAVDDDEEEGGRSTPPTSLHEIPGGEEAFELCAKFCYGISINISAANLAPAFLAARFLQMSESVARGNLVGKLESFLHSYVLQKWKDSLVTLQSAWRLAGWSENGIVQPCLDSVVQKILTPPSKVTWSFTYTRPGYEKKDHRSVPRDWWTEDLADLDLDLFRSVLSTVRAARTLKPALLGEALYVYACKHLTDPMDAAAGTPPASDEQTLAAQRRVVESIVTMIPGEPGAVTGRFLLRLLRVASFVNASPSTKAQLIRLAGAALDDANEGEELLVPLPGRLQSYDVGAAEALMETFLAQFRGPAKEMLPPPLPAMQKVAAVFDAFLQVVARSADLPVPDFVGLAQTLPDQARWRHDALYEALDAYLKEHGEKIGKVDRRRLCRMIDCGRLSPAVRAKAIENDRIPVRTILQLLFAEQERAATMAGAGGGGHGDDDRANIALAEDALDDKRMVQRSKGRHGDHPARAEAMMRPPSTAPARQVVIGNAKSK